MVAVDTIWTAADRRPLRISGSATGTSTRNRIPDSGMPIPRAASTGAGSTVRTASYVVTRMGGTASTTSGIITGSRPKPMSSTESTSRPKLGSARAALATTAIALPPRPVCPVSSPTGRPIAAATARASRVYWTCSRKRDGMPS